jgi:hypothetical protein
MSSNPRVSIPFSDRITIALYEISCAAFVVADLLDGKSVSEADWQRLTLALSRLRALSEAR